ncbi:DegV family protein [Mycoplasmopsis cynos]|uniref:DegV family protein n=1 Tax=Mycoplasmopsis cynos TaxID=171284 RepID=UPI002AFF3EA8|nr:DegV family protein [Mycoplasmopsis cynos]WQQ18636.1 DegV family protein [Mycoplasmopsis cynos]
MKDIAIVIDSSCGLNKYQAEKFGYYFLPLQIEINEKKYNDGIDFDNENFFDFFNLQSKSAKTSATPLGYSKNLLEDLALKYQKVVVFPISSKLSSQYNSLKLISNNIKNIYIVDSVDVAQTILFRIEKFKKSLIKNGFEYAFSEASKWSNKELDITLLPKHNEYLVKGGRLSKGAATIAKLFKIVPLIRFENGSLEKQGKGRIFFKSLQNVLDEKFQIKENNDELVLLGSMTQDMMSLSKYANEKYSLNPIILPIPNVISVHTGPEAIVIIKGKYLSSTLDKYSSFYEEKRI